MIQLSKLLNSSTSAKFLSFIVGLGIAAMLFHKPFERHVTLEIPVADIESKVVRHGSQCFTFHAEDVECEFSDSK